MKRPRPHIPLSVRFLVAYRQACLAMPVRGLLDGSHPMGKRVDQLLEMLFGDEDYQLDHDPALILREFNPRTMKYTPDANDPDHLIYRRKDDHQQKTTGRKPGALRTVTTKGSDIGLKAKFARLEKPRKPRTTIKPRGFAQGRKMKIPSRPFPKR